MNILCVATSYPADTADWRGVFIHHLVHALDRKKEIDLSVWAPPGMLPSTTRYAATDPERDTLGELMADGGIAHVMRSGGLDAVRKPLQLLRMLRALYHREDNIDVYHLNWLQTALPLPANGKPALITVLGTDLKLLKLPLVKPLLRRIMRKRTVTICPNAEWMQAPLEAAFGDIAHIQPVVFGIDPIWYAIKRKPSTEAPSWLAVTRLTRDKLGPLLEWSEPLFKGQARQLHLLGPMQEQISLPDWVHYHGPATPEQLATHWFPQAHGLITLSRHAEGRPQVMLEAMAAGLPIIASDMPAHASLVQQGSSGELCDDEASYSASLQKLDNIEVNRDYGNQARSWVLDQVGTWDDCAQRYLTLYTEMANTTNG
ncbi:group 1 glycosyl transferase [Kineobactrum sediminis]|uniref:Group 1 glycosyl transferase n=1 Tax=Kineobactrum sediminis TaxID=1905677 RepID=A0A2N5XY18_9GAMM|nr:glycosyltransferase family 4 protein [Kineobactrum sediminis]PLW81002.1 group 1 glycosyl transferase [Kineobactrum sediminis]